VFVGTVLNISNVNRKIVIYTRTYYRGADKALAWPGRKKATATEDFDFHISYL